MLSAKASHVGDHVHQHHVRHERCLSGACASTSGERATPPRSERALSRIKSMTTAQKPFKEPDVPEHSAGPARRSLLLAASMTAGEYSWRGLSHDVTTHHRFARSHCRPYHPIQPCAGGLVLSPAAEAGLTNGDAESSSVYSHRIVMRAVTVRGSVPAQRMVDFKTAMDGAATVNLQQRAQTQDIFSELRYAHTTMLLVHRF